MLHSHFIQAASTIKKTATIKKANLDSQDQPQHSSKDLAGLTTFLLGPAVAAGAQSALHWDNEHNYAQDDEMGKLFADFAHKDLIPNYAVELKEADPRTAADLLESIQLPVEPLKPFIPTNAAVDFSTGKTKPRAYAAAETAINEFINEANNSPDTLREKYSPEDIDKLISSINSGNKEEALKRMILTRSFHKPHATVTAPRNNLTSIAHEFGHLDDFARNADLWKKLPGGSTGIPSKALRLAVTPAYSSIGLFSEGARDAVEKLISSDSRLDPLIRGLLSAPIPGVLTSALGISSGLRDAIRSVAPFSPVKKTMDFIDEHPEATAASGYLPQLLREAYTSVPGTRVTQKFYETLNSLKPEEITPELSTMLGKNVDNIGKFAPRLEALKFLGKNTLANLTYALAPITAATAAHYFNSSTPEGQ